MSRDINPKELAGATAYVTGRGGMTVRLKLKDGSSVAMCTCTYGGTNVKDILAEIIVKLWNKKFHATP